MYSRLQSNVEDLLNIGMAVKGMTPIATIAKQQELRYSCRGGCHIGMSQRSLSAGQHSRIMGPRVKALAIG